MQMKYFYCHEIFLLYIEIKSIVHSFSVDAHMGVSAGRTNCNLKKNVRENVYLKSVSIRLYSGVIIN